VKESPTVVGCCEAMPICEICTSQCEEKPHKTETEEIMHWKQLQTTSEDKAHKEDLVHGIVNLQ
jgi:hypothetical protein